MSQPKPWYVDSWRSKPAKQQVEYADQEIFETTVKRIQQLPPLISKGKIVELHISSMICFDCVSTMKYIYIHVKSYITFS